MNPYPQGTELKALETFHFKVNGKGRTVTIKQDDVLWVTNSGTDQNATGLYTLARKGQGTLSHGWAFDAQLIQRYFDILPKGRN